MPRYHFPGYFAFLDAAAERIGRPEAARPARRNAALAALANLCAQAADADPGHVPAILAKAAEFRDQLHAAHRAAELMLADVSAGRGGPALGLPIEPERPTRPEESRPCPTNPPPSNHPGRPSRTSTSSGPRAS